MPDASEKILKQIEKKLKNLDPGTPEFTATLKNYNDLLSTLEITRNNDAKLSLEQQKLEWEKNKEELKPIANIKATKKTSIVGSKKEESHSILKQNASKQNINSLAHSEPQHSRLVPPYLASVSQIPLHVSGQEKYYTTKKPELSPAMAVKTLSAIP